MTANKIIKAFEFCSNADRITECGRCPYYWKGCLDKLHADATDLINRQQAEIEEYKKHIDNDISYVDAVRSETVKRFAERVKELTKKTAFADCWSEGGFLNSVDNLVEEFTEGDKK